MIAEILLYAVILVVSTALTWKGSDALERSGGRLATRYRLPAIVQGTLVVAVGSSFPELTTTIASSLIHGDFSLGLAAIIGSAVFNILVIPGIAGLSGGASDLDIRLVYRDAQFYLTSVAVLLLAFSFALIYEPVPGQILTGKITRAIALVPIVLYGLYVFLQQQEARGEQGTARPSAHEAREPLEHGASADRTNASSALRDWLLLLFGLALIMAGVEGLLRTALWLGKTLHTPSFIWGATVVAAATSLPDALISMRAAKQGEGDISLGNVLGSNIFNLLVAVPVGVLVAGSTPIHYGIAAPLMAALTFATVLLFAAMRTKLWLTRAESILLLAVYAAFVIWLVLETLGLTSVLRGASAARSI